MNDIEKAVAEIDVRFPPPPEPRGPLFYVVSVSSDGVVIVMNAPSIKLDGAKCSPQGVKYIQRMITGEGDLIAFEPSVRSIREPIPAAVWRVLSLEVKSKAIRSYASIQDTALTSGWCTAVKTATTKEYPRYAALAEIARRKP
jgi:hypothetical protein